MQSRLVLLFLISLMSVTLRLSASDSTSIYQYFLPYEGTNSRFGSGAYLWVPPETERIRAVMVGIHNGLPISVLENEEVRKVCTKHGIAQILMTPNGSDIGLLMLKNLCYDFTDPERTALYDRYLCGLAALSDHPELTNAPVIPMAHSAYCSFPFEAAMRNPAQCLAIIPIKAGLPDVYKTYGPSGTALHPDASHALSNVPILFISSATQETVTSQWKSEPFPHKMGINPLLSIYRQDTNSTAGDAYTPRNELAGICHDPNLGHFNMLPRDYHFVAEWLDEIASRRLPKEPGQPLVNMFLRDGWLVNGENPETNNIPPAPYASFIGRRTRAYWYPSESLAREAETLIKGDYLKHQDLFTVLGEDGQPVSLAETPGANLTNVFTMMTNDGLVTLTTHHFTKPPEICTNMVKGHETNGGAHTYSNILFPGLSELAVSTNSLRIDLNGSPFEVAGTGTKTSINGVNETSFILRLKPNRMTRAGSLCCPMIYHDGNGEDAAACRGVMMRWGDTPREWVGQKIAFPPVPDISRTQKKVALQATTDKNLPVGYFVQKGPGVIEDGCFVVRDLPKSFHKPIEVTVGAFQRGRIEGKEKSVRPSDIVFQGFKILP